MLTIYYDMEVAPPTYELVTFLCRAECERIARGHERVHVVFLPGPVDGFRRDRLWPYGTDARRAMLRDVAVPLCRLLPSVEMVTVRNDRQGVPRDGLGVLRRFYGFAEQVNACRKGVRPLRARGPAIGREADLVTITLREAEHWPDRNSSVADWLAAAQWMRDVQGLRAVFVRDAAKAGEGLDGFETDAAAATDIAARARLYSRAALNLFVSNGPAWLCAAMDLPAAIFRPVQEGSIRAFAANYLRECGVVPGGQIPGAPSYLRLVWQRDTAENIVAAVERFLSAERQVA